MRHLHLLTTRPRVVSDTGLLILRLAAAAVFIAHGWGDVVNAGVSSNVENYRGAGIPWPEVSAPFAAYIQLFGGIALFLGLLTRPLVAGLTVVMAGALIWVHRGESLVMGQDGSGSGFAFVMGVASLAMLFTGPGRFSIDHIIADRWARSTPNREAREQQIRTSERAEHAVTAGQPAGR